MTKNLHKKSFIILLAVFSIFMFFSFQNCSQKKKGIGSFHNSPNSCQLHDAELTETSLCARINNSETNVCWQDSSFVHLEADDTLDEILKNLHICDFTGDTSAAQITSFTVNDTSLHVSSDSSDNLSIALSVNSSAVDENGDLQLFSFASNTPIDEDTSCAIKIPILYRVGVDENDDVLLSDDPNVTCGPVTVTTEGETQLSCQYAANQPGCIFKLTLWSYDSSDHFSQKKSIQVQMQED